MSTSILDNLIGGIGKEVVERFPCGFLGAPQDLKIEGMTVVSLMGSTEMTFMAENLVEEISFLSGNGP